MRQVEADEAREKERGLGHRVQSIVWEVQMLQAGKWRENWDGNRLFFVKSSQIFMESEFADFKCWREAGHWPSGWMTCRWLQLRSKLCRLLIAMFSSELLVTDLTLLWLRLSVINLLYPTRSSILQTQVMMWIQSSLFILPRVPQMLDVVGCDWQRLKGSETRELPETLKYVKNSQ